MEKRYSFLRTIGMLYKVLGGLVGVLTILGVLGFCLTAVLGGAAMGTGRGDSAIAEMLGSTIGGIIGSIFLLIYGGVIAISLFAAGEFVYLFIALEENTRQTAMMLQQQNTKPPLG